MQPLWLFASLASGAPAARVASVPDANVQRPAWSPDGKLLSFEANFHEAKRIELYLGEPRDGGFRKIVASTRSAGTLTETFQTVRSGQVVHELAFAPRGINAYVFAASNERFDYDLYISEGTTVAAGPGADGGARWSPDGKYIAFTSARSGEGDLYLIETRQIEAPPKRLTSQTDSSELYVDWSSDGKSLAYVAHSDKGDNLWVMPGIGASPSRLTTWPGNQIRPRFSPTGDRIAFYANHDDSERFDLYVVEIGAAPRMISRGVYPDARGPAWTADGKHIVYVAADDAHYNPVRAVAIDEPTRNAVVDLGTVGNGDLDLTVRDGSTWIAVVAQGRVEDQKRDFKQLYTAQLPVLP
jgi:Tol biopolymer transport system component